jgi:hypothetical protein
LGDVLGLIAEAPQTWAAQEWAAQEWAAQEWAAQEWKLSARRFENLVI